jgi:hypothetical protein
MTGRIRLIALLLCSLGLTGHAQMMYVRQKSGPKTIFTISDIRKITFSVGYMIIYGLDGNSETFGSTDIQYVNFTDVSTGIHPSEKQKPALLIFFPNPVQDILTLNYKSLGETILFEVMTLEGKTVQVRNINMHSGINQVKINVSSLPKGMYLCRLIDGNAILTNKFLKD